MSPDVEEIVPNDSFLGLEDYLGLFKIVSSMTKFRILHRLVQDGETSISELAAALDKDESTISGHLKDMVEEGLVRNRREKRTGSAESYSFYTATPLGERLYEAAEDFISAERTDSADEEIGPSAGTQDEIETKPQAEGVAMEQTPQSAMTVSVPFLDDDRRWADEEDTPNAIVVRHDGSDIYVPIEGRAGLEEDHFAVHRKQIGLRKKVEEHIQTAFQGDSECGFQSPLAFRDR